MGDRLHPNRAGHLLRPGQTGHAVWWAEYGKPDGDPVLLVHGSAGLTLDPADLPGLDLARQRVVVLHQRGVGMSRPAGAVTENTTAELVADMEALRAHLALERWTLLGWSWGAALALLYGQAHPDRVRGILAFGPYLATPEEARRGFAPAAMAPEFHAAFTRFHGAADPDAIIRSIAAKAQAPDRRTRLRNAWFWLNFPDGNGPGWSTVSRHWPRDRQDALMNRIAPYATMMARGYDLAPDAIEAGLPRLKDVPVFFHGGDQDQVIDFATVRRIQSALPRATLHWAANGGHGIWDAEAQAAIGAGFAWLARTLSTPANDPAPPARRKGPARRFG